MQTRLPQGGGEGAEEEQAARQVSRAASRGAWRSSRPTSAELPLGGALHISAAPASRGAPGPSARYLQPNEQKICDIRHAAAHQRMRPPSRGAPAPSARYLQVIRMLTFWSSCV